MSWLRNLGFRSYPIMVLRASAEGMVDAALVIASAVIWTCGQGWWLLRRGTVPGALDVAVLLGCA